MSSAQSPGTSKDTMPGDTQHLDVTNTESQPPEHKKHARPAISLHKKVSSKRLVGRLPVTPTESSQSGTESVSRASLAPDHQKEKSRGMEKNDGRAESADRHRHHHHRLSASAGGVTGLLEQLKDWAYAERQRQKARRDRKAAKKTEQNRATISLTTSPTTVDREVDGGAFGEPLSLVSSSGDEAAQAAMDAFDALVSAAELSHSEEYPKRPSVGRKRSSKKRHARNTSDTDYTSDGETLVPSCEEVLQTAEEVGMDEFKSQVLKLAHTLRCKGWRRVTLDRYREIVVERISGALTNIVYAVIPPSDLPPISTTNETKSSSNISLGSMKIPAKLLLRIYGPQVSHLIDRETELTILRRLARKRIGPHLLGTFENGRFEEFFPSRTLTRDDIKKPEISRHIAKRLKELHEGIDLEEGERKGGSIAWRNWEKWAPRARSVVVDVGINETKMGPVIGCSWEKFEQVANKYKEWLYARYGGLEGVKKTLVFAHNDTQYGNILRLEPAGKSPLLLPMNEHKQFVVIDFEYSSANPPAFEFANHFCEWMADYGDPATPYFMHHSQFPNLEQQRNFIRAYVEHSLTGARSPTTGTSDASPSTPSTPFNLDARTPAPAYKEEEAARQRLVEKEVERLIEESRAWRALCNLMWCVWGIVQAKVGPDGVEKAGSPKESATTNKQALSKEASIIANDTKDRKDEDEDEFDYLAYAQQRALLFWGDTLGLGIVKPEEVGEFIMKNVKWVE